MPLFPLSIQQALRSGNHPVPTRIPCLCPQSPNFPRLSRPLTSLLPRAPPPVSPALPAWRCAGPGLAPRRVGRRAAERALAAFPCRPERPRRFDITPEPSAVRSRGFGKCKAFGFLGHLPSTPQPATITQHFPGSQSIPGEMSGGVFHDFLSHLLRRGGRVCWKDTC